MEYFLVKNRASLLTLPCTSSCAARPGRTCRRACHDVGRPGHHVHRQQAKGGTLRLCRTHRTFLLVSFFWFFVPAPSPCPRRRPISLSLFPPIAASALSNARRTSRLSLVVIEACNLACIHVRDRVGSRVFRLQSPADSSRRRRRQLT